MTFSSHILCIRGLKGGSNVMSLFSTHRYVMFSLTALSPWKQTTELQQWTRLYLSYSSCLFVSQPHDTSPGCGGGWDRVSWQMAGWWAVGEPSVLFANSCGDKDWIYLDREQFTVDVFTLYVVVQRLNSSSLTEGSWFKPPCWMVSEGLLNQSETAPLIDVLRKLKAAFSPSYTCAVI